MDAEFLFMDDNARPHRANIIDECLQSEDITCFVKAEMKKKVTYNPCVQIRTTCQQKSHVRKGSIDRGFYMDDVRVRVPEDDIISEKPHLTPSRDDFSQCPQYMGKRARAQD
ncbi:hypothetical protein TNCV_1073401 [Trichonephila clavipes]|nr:hypothetical protein TNCV_1073401 [Trichonephila clavipes]